MKKTSLFVIGLCLSVVRANAQTDSTQCMSSCCHRHEVHQAVEFESLFPMFMTGGFHLAAGYRYEKFRFRASVINGGSYDAESAGLKNASPDFKRYYKTSPGFFFGYNLWRNLELYSYLELHTFSIEQVSTGATQDLHSTDVGAGISYQLFLTKGLYIQPGFHAYFRKSQSLDFGDQTYHIPTVDLSPVVRVGYRIWSK